MRRAGRYGSPTRDKTLALEPENTTQIAAVGRAMLGLWKAYRFGRWRAGVGTQRPAEKAMIAGQATERTNEEGCKQA